MQSATGPISWRLTIALQLVWAGITAIGTIMGPELPRYYIQRGNIDRARQNLSKLRDLPVGDEELEAEIQEMIKRNEEENAAGDFGYLDCFRSEGRLRLRTLIGIAVQVGEGSGPGAATSSSAILTLYGDLQAGQQWTGINFFFSFGTKFFANAGIS
jgi:SP family sugar:H+ symporter-like MFS transporter